jgi:hypothetical protein
MTSRALGSSMTTTASYSRPTVTTMHGGGVAPAAANMPTWSYTSWSTPHSYRPASSSGIRAPQNAPLPMATPASSGGDYVHAPKSHNPGLKIPNFTYNSDVHLFLERMDMYFSSAQTRAENKTQIVLGALDDITLNAVLKEKKAGRTFDTYDTLKAFLIKRFTSSETGCTARLSFKLSSQQANESPDDYLTKLLGLALDGFPSMTGDSLNQMVLMRFCEGIRDSSIRLKLLEHDPQSIEDALGYVKTLQKLKAYSDALEGDKTNQAKTQISSDLPVTKIAAVTWRDNENRHNYYNSYNNYRDKPSPPMYRRTSSGRPICNFCGEANHIERHCFKKQRMLDTNDEYRRDYRKSDRRDSRGRYRDNSVNRARDSRSNSPSDKDRSESRDRWRDKSSNWSRNRDRYHSSSSRERDSRIDESPERDERRSSNKRVSVLTYNCASALSVPCEINGQIVNCVLDTGSEISLLHTDVWTKIRKNEKLLHNNKEAYSVNNVPIPITGVVTLSFKIKGTTNANARIMIKQQFYVTSCISYNAILGIDFTNKNRASVSTSDRKMTIVRNGWTSIHRLRSSLNDDYLTSTIVADTATMPARSQKHVTIASGELLENKNAACNEKESTLSLPHKPGIIVPYTLVDNKFETLVFTTINTDTLDVILCNNRRRREATAHFNRLHTEPTDDESNNFVGATEKGVSNNNGSALINAGDTYNKATASSIDQKAINADSATENMNDSTITPGAQCAEITADTGLSSSTRACLLKPTFGSYTWLGRGNSERYATGSKASLLLSCVMFMCCLKPILSGLTLTKDINSAYGLEDAILCTASRTGTKLDVLDHWRLQNSS